jgi:hypothetical protein
MNSNALLALLGDLYAQIAALTEANNELRNQLRLVNSDTADPRS